jgi:hypothetical protein
MIRPKKEDAIRVATLITPLYVNFFQELKLNNRSGIGFQTEVQKIRSNISEYVLLYDDERKIALALFYALMGKSGFKEYSKDLDGLTLEEQQSHIDDLMSISEEELYELGKFFEVPQTPNEWESARATFNSLAKEEQEELLFICICIWSFAFCSLFNFLALMVLGAKLTDLIPKAIGGDDEALIKAVQIDKQLLIAHPYFIQRKRTLQDEQHLHDENPILLRRISYSENKPLFNSKIQYPALYMLFGILQYFQWLDDLSYKEILQICDDAGLDRYHNRIEDPLYLGKRLQEFRKWQKINHKSMHSD